METYRREEKTKTETTLHQKTRVNNRKSEEQEARRDKKNHIEKRTETAASQCDPGPSRLYITTQNNYRYVGKFSVETQRSKMKMV